MYPYEPVLQEEGEHPKAREEEEGQEEERANFRDQRAGCENEETKTARPEREREQDPQRATTRSNDRVPPMQEE